MLGECHQWDYLGCFVKYTFLDQTLHLLGQHPCGGGGWRRWNLGICLFLKLLRRYWHVSGSGNNQVAQLGDREPLRVHAELGPHLTLRHVPATGKRLKEDVSANWRGRSGSLWHKDTGGTCTHMRRPWRPGTLARLCHLLPSSIFQETSFTWSELQLRFCRYQLLSTYYVETLNLQKHKVSFFAPPLPSH